MSAFDENEIAKKLNRTLGLYKAEWLNEALFTLFSEPAYFDQLQTPRPCVLIGGRGTGKTTVLRGLSYEGQHALSNAKDDVKHWPHYGLYYRVNTNRVTAFKGAELSEDRWAVVFGHYINLIFCQLLLDFVQWYQEKTSQRVALSGRYLRRIAKSLAIGDVADLDELSEEVHLALLDFEAAINTIVDEAPKSISALGAPLDELAEALSTTECLKNKQFFFLIDEFENFEDYQQKVLNTLIKHANSNYTFKVGVRELGWRQRATLNPNEQLTSPADYARISISEWLDEARFNKFAHSVVSSRMASAFLSQHENGLPIESLFPALTELDEAELLLGLDERELLLKRARQALPEGLHEKMARIRVGHLFFLNYWANGDDLGFGENIVSWLEREDLWRMRLTNHMHAALFTIRKGKRGVRKFYCGWDVFVSLADGNIRYLLELVHAAFLKHLENGGRPDSPISPKAQTLAAAEVGKKNLSELEGLSVDGGKLTKLVLSLGRIFQVMASDAKGHAPEVNQFCLRDEHVGDRRNELPRRILDQAVMHLALDRSTGSKPTSDSDTLEYDYRLHPIFSPLFVFSHRRKRKFVLGSRQLLDLIEKPRDAIREVLAQSNRPDGEDLPDQLQLFGGFYAGD